MLERVVVDDEIDLIPADIKMVHQCGGLCRRAITGKPFAIALERCDQFPELTSDAIDASTVTVQCLCAVEASQTFLIGQDIETLSSVTAACQLSKPA